MSIEKSITLIVVAFIATLLAWVIFSREDRAQTSPETTTNEKRAGLRDLQEKKRGGGRRVDFESARAGDWKTPANPANRAEKPAAARKPRNGGVANAAVVTPPRDDERGGRTIEVRRGDSFYRIAERELGDSRRYLDIARANPGVDPRRLKPGQKIVLPAASKRPAPPSNKDVPDGARSYTVRRGDTLSGIARRFYGSATKWPRLLEANRDRLSSPKKLRPGMTVVIP